MTRHFRTISEVSDKSLHRILKGATGPIDDELLAGQGVAAVFERPSLRTRAAISSSVQQLGGYVTMFGGDEVGLDVRESAEDVGRMLSQMYAIAALRVRRHDVLDRMATASANSMSIINLLSDVAHPTQAIADALTLAEHFGNGKLSSLRGLTVAYVGDATNVTRSLAVLLLRLGANVTVGAPDGYQLTNGSLEDPFVVREGGSFQLTDSPHTAVTGADAVYTDAWVSMGMEDETAQRRRDLASFRVDAELLARAKPGAVVLHCLPAHRGDEITDEVIDGTTSLVWRQAYHRRTALLGILRWIKEKQ